MDIERISALKEEFLEALRMVKDEKSLIELEVRFLGRKSELNAILKGLKDASPEERQKLGPAANSMKREWMAAFDETRQRLKEENIDWEAERVDVTAPGKILPQGHLHILTQVQRDIEDIFISMGFDIADGPEIETEFYNFDALNVPAHHPARDMQDTFWIQGEEDDISGSLKKSERLLLRTHTSAVQVRYMEKHTPPFRIIIPGRIFRNEATDATHEHTFYQFESLMVGDDVSVANFKYVAETFFSLFFGQKVSIRLRPSFFPFTEPSFEFDIQCTLCAGEGCSGCKGVGWLEIGGAGMVHRKVLEAAGYEPGRYQGFAWGFGINRLAMMKYGIADIRLFHGGDMRFLSQF